MRTIPELKEGTHRAKASGTLPNGRAVVVNADGTVSAVTGTPHSQDVGSNVTFEGGATNFTSATFDSNSNKVFVAYEDDANSDRQKAVVGTVDPSDNSITFGSPVTFNSSAGSYTSCCFDTNADKVVVIYKDDSPGYHHARVGTISGNSVSFGFEATLFSSVGYPVDCCFDSTNNKVFVCGRDNNGSGTGRELYGVVGTVSGTTISFGSFATIGPSGETPSDTKCCYDSSKDRIVVVWRNVDDASAGYAAVGQISGTSVTFGAEAEFVSSVTSIGTACVFDSSANKVVIIYTDGSNSNKGTATVADIDATNNTISFNTPVVFSTAAGARPAVAYDSNAGKIVVAYSDFNNSWYGMCVSGLVRGTSITFDTPTVVNSTSTYYSSATFDSNSNRVVIASGTPTAGGVSTVFQAGYTALNLTVENYIGVSQGVVADGSVTQVVGGATVFESATADLISATFDSNLNKVVVAYQDEGNSGYGTSVVGTVSGDSISFGTPVVFNSANSDFISSTFDSNSNKIVISFRDLGNGARGKAIVGTVSGTSISFGTEVDFNNSEIENTATTFDSNSNKVVISWNDKANNSEAGTSIVGTVSGTSISFGSAVVFAAPITRDIVSTFDSNSNKIVISYRDSGNSQAGTAIVGTVSGTSISFGTEVVFQAAAGDLKEQAITFDTSSNKVVIAYADVGNSSYGTARVGTVSGTSISFGEPVVFEAASVSNARMGASYDSSVSRVVISYRDNGNSNYGTLVVGSVSGTSISFESPVVYEAATTDDISSTFDSNSNKVVIAYQDVGNSNYGTALVTKTGYTNITRGQVNAGSSATVDIIGSLSTNQLGLTARQSYYVQSDGTIGETPDFPSVFAGTAMSATSLVVKK